MNAFEWADTSQNIFYSWKERLSSKISSLKEDLSFLFKEHYELPHNQEVCCDGPGKCLQEAYSTSRCSGKRTWVEPRYRTRWSLLRDGVIKQGEKLMCNTLEFSGRNCSLHFRVRRMAETIIQIHILETIFLEIRDLVLIFVFWLFDAPDEIGSSMKWEYFQFLPCLRNDYQQLNASI